MVCLQNKKNQLYFSSGFVVDKARQLHVLLFLVVDVLTLVLDFLNKHASFRCDAFRTQERAKQQIWVEPRLLPKYQGKKITGEYIKVEILAC